WWAAADSSRGADWAWRRVEPRRYHHLCAHEYRRTVESVSERRADDTADRTNRQRIAPVPAIRRRQSQVHLPEQSGVTREPRHIRRIDRWFAAAAHPPRR